MYTTIWWPIAAGALGALLLIGALLLALFRLLLGTAERVGAGEYE